MPYKTYQQGTTASTPGKQAPAAATPAAAAAKPTAMAAANEDVTMKPVTRKSWDQPPEEAGDQQAGNAAAVAGGEEAGKRFFPKKFSGVDKSKLRPISNAVRKKRTNFRLRKIIVPKAPIMVLNEMVGAVSYTWGENPPMPPMANPNIKLFTAQCVVEGHTFSGTGPSKQIAKNICAEHAIQFVVQQKCADPKNKIQKDEEGNPLKPNQMTDETPWAQLASLALFKLFNDWQAQGFPVPPELFKAPDASNTQTQAQAQAAPVKMESDDAQPGNGATSAGVKKIPENATDRHPVQLLNEIRGPVAYNLQEERGSPPNVLFIMNLVIDGKSYTGEGRNKKEAKRACAVSVLRQLHGVVYPDANVSATA